jgi:hypothetical protein
LHGERFLACFAMGGDHWPIGRQVSQQGCRDLCRRR